MFNREYHIRAVRREVRKSLLSGAAQEFYRPAKRPLPGAGIGDPERPLADIFPLAYNDPPRPEPDPGEGDSNLPVGRKCSRRRKVNDLQLQLFA